MRILTLEEGESLVEPIWGFTLTASASELLRKEGQAFLLPTDSGHKTALSRQVCYTISFPAFLWIHEHGIWPTSENPDLFVLVRAGLGETRNLDAAPLHVLERDELYALHSLLSLVLYFVWGAILFEPAYRRTWLFSHDEWVSLSCPDSQALAAAIEVLTRFGLQPTTF